MRKSRFTEAQIIGMSKEQDAGMPTAEVSLNLRKDKTRQPRPSWQVSSPGLVSNST